MSVEITCGKCGEKIVTMKMLKSLKDVLNPSNGKYNNEVIHFASEFSLDDNYKILTMIFLLIFLLFCQKKLL